MSGAASCNAEAGAKVRVEGTRKREKFPRTGNSAQSEVWCGESGLCRDRTCDPLIKSLRVTVAAKKTPEGAKPAPDMHPL